MEGPEESRDKKKKKVGVWVESDSELRSKFVKAHQGCHFQETNNGFVQMCVSAHVSFCKKKEKRSYSSERQKQVLEVQASFRSS